MTVFADSSALVKLYVDEPGAQEVRPVRVMAVSAIARVEVPAALWRKARTGHLAAGLARVLIADFEADWYGVVPTEEPRFAAVQVAEPVLDVAARLVGVHGLRAYDAVQLACALAVRSADPAVDVLACFDTGLRAAGVAEGFDLLPA